MKQFLYILFLAMIAGCGDNSSPAGKESKTTVNEEANLESGSAQSEPDIDEVNVDTIGMAEFLALKAAEAARYGQSDRIGSNDVTDMNDISADTTGFAEFKRLKAETARQAFEDSTRRAEIIAERKKNNISRNSRSNTTERSARESESADETVSSDQSQATKESPDTVKEKKGWSKKAKGAVIGAATGAAAGAVIHKRNRKVGGVVGGVVGAAAGYGIGRHKDKKDTARQEEERIDTSDQE